MWCFATQLVFKVHPCYSICQYFILFYGQITFHCMILTHFIYSFFFFFLNHLFPFIYLFYLLFYGCVGSSFLCEGFLQLRQVGATLHCGAQASHYRGLSCCGAQAQQLWLTGLVAPWHVGSSQTRAQTRVPCISRQILNHCTTREAPIYSFFMNSQVVFNFLIVVTNAAVNICVLQVFV